MGNIKEPPCPECGQPYIPWAERDKARLIEKDDAYQANLIADALIDYIRAPYSRSWLVDRISAALKQEGLVAGADGSSAAGAAPVASRQSLTPALQDALGEIEAFLQDQHDIRDGAGGQQLPNKAMSLSIALKEAMGERP